MSSFQVSEIFESVQGEGRFLGRPSTFLRLAQCNLQCIWCDSAYTWRFSEKQQHQYPAVFKKEDEITEMSPELVFNVVKNYQPSHLVITGGEPLLQDTKIEELCKLLQADSSRQWSVEIETAGTLMPLHFHVQYTVSPKLASSKNDLHLRRRWDKLKALAKEDSVFKFVVCDMIDLDEIDSIVKGLEVDPDRVYVMAEGTDAETLSSRTTAIIPLAIQRGYRVTTRLQIYAWGNRRGV